LSGEPTTYSAKEYVLNKQNTLSIYEIHVVNALERLELVAWKVIFQFFSALDDESTMVRVSAWIILLVKQASHMKEKRRGNVSSGSEKHGSSSSDSSSTSAGPKKKGKGVMGNKAKKEEDQVRV